MPSGNPTLADAQENWQTLDAEHFSVPQGVRILSNNPYDAENSDLPVEHAVPQGLARFFQKLGKRFRSLFAFFYAWQVLRAADENTAVIFDATYKGASWLYAGYLNRMMRKRCCLILRDCFLEYKLGTEKRLKWLPFIKIKTSWKEAVARGSLMGYDLITLWSRKQIKPHAELYQLPENRFIFVPYKADHAQDSKTDVCDIPINNFIFSGGNDKRDYKTLVEAVKETNIPVIISATSSATRSTVEYQPNVIVLGAPEPAFAQLQAACRFVVISMINSDLKGGGEANFCNAGWHHKPVVAADTMAADDYIIEGETGYIVPSGDVEGLRKRILELWNDPKKCEEMGRKGREHCEKWFKHSISMRRIIHTAIVCWENKKSEPLR